MSLQKYYFGAIAMVLLVILLGCMKQGAMAASFKHYQIGRDYLSLPNINEFSCRNTEHKGRRVMTTEGKMSIDYGGSCSQSVGGESIAHVPTVMLAFSFDGNDRIRSVVVHFNWSDADRIRSALVDRYGEGANTIPSHPKPGQSHFWERGNAVLELKKSALVTWFEPIIRSGRTSRGAVQAQHSAGFSV